MAERRRPRLPRAMGWLALLPLALYAMLCAALFLGQRALIYYPQATAADAATTDFQLRRDDAVLRGWVLRPGRRDALLYFGGNAERVELNRDALLLHSGDRSVYLLPYRGYGASSGTPSQTALHADALAWFDEVARRHPHGRIAVIGRSLGSGIASHVAARRPVERLALVTPFDSLAAVAQAHYRWLPVRWLLRDRYPSIRELPRYRGDVLILRAGRDVVVPPANTDRLIAALRQPPRVVDFPQADHNDLSDSPRYWQALEDFLATSPAR